MLAFAGILQAPEPSSKLSHRLCTAENRKLQPLSSKLMNMDTSTVVQVAEPAEREVARLRSVRPYPSSCIEREGNGRRVIHSLLTILDPNPDAMPCNSEQSREQRTAYLCEFCKPVQPSATPDRTLVKRLWVSGSSPLVGSPILRVGPVSGYLWLPERDCRVALGFRLRVRSAGRAKHVPRPAVHMLAGLRARWMR